MAVFKVHQRVIEDCRTFTSGLAPVHDRRIQQFVDEQSSEGVQWPDAWISLNSSFELDAAMSHLSGLSRHVAMDSAANSTPYRSSLTLLPGRPCNWPASEGEQ